MKEISNSHDAQVYLAGKVVHAILSNPDLLARNDQGELDIYWDQIAEDVAVMAEKIYNNIAKNEA